jgi:hypothetical protein
MATFEASATYTATVRSVCMNADGSASVNVRNTDAVGNVISDVVIAVPADHAQNVTHQRTGDAGVAISADFSDSITAALAQASALLAAVIGNEKHAL